MATSTVDLLLVFPPQWSPFQPPLSLPALSAWLKRDQFAVASVDANLSFYKWLFSSECVAILLSELASKDWDATQKTGYEAILSSASDFWEDLSSLRAMQHDKGESDLVDDYYIANRSFGAYLTAVSAICEDFHISPHGFRLKKGNLSIESLERVASEPPVLLKAFVDFFVDGLRCKYNAQAVGLSCIGQEQLLFTMLIGQKIKSVLNVPVLVGGTIFSRIFERGNLLSGWFGRFFDVIVRNEGERPCSAMLANLRHNRMLTEAVPGIVFSTDGQIHSTPPAAPLRPNELPIPDFDDLPIHSYLSSTTTLPLLASRGCYWGKCEFCHHGMVYGNKYEAYEANSVLECIELYSKKYGVKQFAFNDEAVPPKLLKAFGRLFPDQQESGRTFTGLIKFEKVYTAEDFQAISRIGFRSLYIGFESGSERVLRLMKKNNTQEVMLRNLTDGTTAGVWMHCFVFFGFPGEQQADAQMTYDFLMDHHDVIASIGCGTFSLEHNAPIYHHTSDFGVEIKPAAKLSLDVYYDYKVVDGIDAREAQRWSDHLTESAGQIPKYGSTGWIPREHLLAMLSRMPMGDLVKACVAIKNNRGLPPGASISHVSSVRPKDNRLLCINRLNLRVLTIQGESADVFVAAHESDETLATVSTFAPALFEYFVLAADTLSATAFAH